MSDHPSITKDLRALRKIIGYSQTRLAELVGVVLGTIQSVEIGRLKPSAELLRRISDETGCGLDFGSDHPGQLGISFGDNGKLIRLDPNGIKLVQRFHYRSSGPRVVFSPNENTDKPFTLEYFELHRRVRESKAKLSTFERAVQEFISAVLTSSTIYAELEADASGNKDKAVQSMRETIDGILDGMIRAAGSSFNGIDEVTHHLEANRWWAVDWSKYPNGYVPEDLVKSLRDLVSDDDLRAIIFPGGTSPQN